MSRPTFPRAVAAGLVAAALGSAPPAFAQVLNPWRGECATPVAPAQRAKPTRQLTISLGLNGVGGLTGSIVVRDLTALPVAPPPREVAPLPAAWHLERYPQFFPPVASAPLPRERATPTDPTGVVPAAFTVPAVGRYMPPPRPLPVTAPLPDVIPMPIDFDLLLPLRGVIPFWPPAGNEAPRTTRG